MFKITDKIISLFIFDNNGWVVDFQNYYISISGIKWELKKEENFLREITINSLKRYNNKLLFLGEYKSFLIDMIIKKNDIKENLNEMEINKNDNEENLNEMEINKNDIKEDNKENEGNYSNCIII